MERALNGKGPANFVMEDLKESTEFLNLLVDNVTSAVFLVDKGVRLRQFNNAFQKLFSKDEARLIANLCGNAIGCAFAVEEDTECGCSSHCNNCVLRKSILKAFTEEVPTYRARLDRVFYIVDKPVQKHFIYSSLLVTYRGESVTMVIVDDYTELENQRLELVEKQRRLDDDLRSAAMIQRSLLPVKTPDWDEISVAAKFIPSSLIGGDIYNVFALDEERLVMYMIDVSGHGVTAAMVTVSISQFLHPSAGYFGPGSAGNMGDRSNELCEPITVLEALDAHYPIERFNEYFTIIYMVLNVKTGELIYSGAGHPSPMLVRPDAQPEPLKTRGTIIGLGGRAPFDQGKRILEPGAKIIAYTDGITEYRGNRDEPFGADGLTRFAQSMGKLSASEFADELFKTLMTYGANTQPSDDATLLVIDYLGP
jgi:sigma-B regulation protein RsbU (phosphoserine phosphatase)